MFCANHPDVPAMATCQVCGKPLCSVCIYFHNGMAYCREHYPEAGSATVAFNGARGGGEDETRSFNDPAVNAAPNPPQYAEPQSAPVMPPQMQPQWPVAPQPQGPHWSSDPRLTPMPMQLRPGWSQEPLAPEPGNADALGTAGLTIGALGLVGAVCCGVAAPAGVILGLLAAGLSVAALRGADRSRNPNGARIRGGIGIGLGVLAVLGGTLISALLLGTGFGEIFFK